MPRHDQTHKSAEHGRRMAKRIITVCKIEDITAAVITQRLKSIVKYPRHELQSLFFLEIFYKL